MTTITSLGTTAERLQALAIDLAKVDPFRALELASTIESVALGSLAANSEGTNTITLKLVLPHGDTYRLSSVKIDVPVGIPDSHVAYFAERQYLAQNSDSGVVAIWVEQIAPATEKANSKSQIDVTATLVSVEDAGITRTVSILPWVQARSDEELLRFPQNKTTKAMAENSTTLINFVALHVDALTFFAECEGDWDVKINWKELAAWVEEHRQHLARAEG